MSSNQSRLTSAIRVSTMLGTAVAPLLVVLGVTTATAPVAADTALPATRITIPATAPTSVGTQPQTPQTIIASTRAPADSNDTSSTWAGYVVTGAKYTSASTSFVVPQLTSCAASENAWASFWAGIDGFGNSTVEQSGIDANCDNGTVHYLAWTEMYPANAVVVPNFPVSAGDSITVAVAYQGDNSYKLSVTDNTDHTTYSNIASSPSLANASAECITEDPQAAPQVGVPYADYAPVTFSGCQVNGVNIGDLSPDAIIGQTATTVLAVPSALSAGNTFTVSREDTPLTAPNQTPVTTTGSTDPTGSTGPGTSYGQAPGVTTRVVGIAATPSGHGYWEVDAAGSIATFGDAKYFGSMYGHPLNKPISHIVATMDGNGYWLVASDGGIFAFGDAGFYGSMGATHLNAPVVDMAPDAAGTGYWLVAADGGVFSFGSATFHGSTGNLHLNKPVVGISPDVSTGGYWLVASDGGVFAFDAPFYGSTGNLHLNQPVVSMAADAAGTGYWFVASDGGIFSFGTATFHGSLGGSPSPSPTVGMAANTASTGYWLVQADGQITGFGTQTY
jgi:hypothetical protein